MPLSFSTLAAVSNASDARLPGFGMDALVVSHPPNLRYLANHAGTAGLAVITGTRVPCSWTSDT